MHLFPERICNMKAVEVANLFNYRQTNSQSFGPGRFLEAIENDFFIEQFCTRIITNREVISGGFNFNFPCGNVVPDGICQKIVEQNIGENRIHCHFALVERCRNF